MEAKTSWMGEVKETEPVWEENPISYGEELMARRLYLRIREY